LSRERVLSAAIALADEGGLEALSMRRLATELGVEAMSLYNHVANKGEILDGIVDLVTAEIELPVRGADWKEALRRSAISCHDVLLRHPWAAGLGMSRRTPSPARLRLADATLRAFRDGGFSDDLTYHGFHVLQSHVTGYTLYALGLRIDAEELKEMAANFLRDFRADEYPDMAVHVQQHMEPGDAHRNTFEFGLDLILGSLERLRDGV
jgi:AcrR family transcriptional regulator